MDLSKFSAPELIERLAAIEHERWSHWQSYLHGVCVKNVDGSLTIPSELVSRWERQMSADYAELSEREKESDRDQVLLYLPIVQDFIAADLPSPKSKN